MLGTVSEKLVLQVGAEVIAANVFLDCALVRACSLCKVLHGCHASGSAFGWYLLCAED
jgi:hypothetical protein